ncbi:hypothetical protein AB1283_00535 [Bacillus sp. S13(2024)]|uniref:hypothetical protein n=1 Tax=Bacillus sp. S13(2024) TaxID=3162885 RepID=UPI003D204E7B
MKILTGEFIGSPNGVPDNYTLQNIEYPQVTKKHIFKNISSGKMSYFSAKEYLEQIKNIETVNVDSQKSTTSAVGRSAVGMAAAGAVGGVIGATTAKNKNTYLISIEYFNGVTDLAEVTQREFNFLVTQAHRNKNLTSNDELVFYEMSEQEEKQRNKKDLILFFSLLGAAAILFLIGFMIPS